MKSWNQKSIGRWSVIWGACNKSLAQAPYVK